MRALAVWCWLVIAGFAAIPSSAASVGARDVLDRVRAAYGDVQSYGDAGTIRVDGEPRWRFSTAYDSRTGYVLTLDDSRSGDRLAVFWSSEAGEYRYDAVADEGRPVSYLLSEILGTVGSGARVGLLPAVLLLQGEAGLPEPEALALDGPLACAEGGVGDGDCYLLSGGVLGATVEFELWVAVDDYRLRAADVEAVGAAELASNGRARPRRLRVDYGETRFDDPLLEIRMPAPIEEAPPLPAVTPVEISVDTTAEAVPSDEGDFVFGETVEVRLTSVTMRAIDSRGDAIRDLEVADLRLTVGGEEVAVEALEWVESASPQIDLPPEVLAREGIVTAPPGKLIVVFVQADLEASRAYGQLRMMPRVRELLDSLGRDDWVAVVSFDSHLKLRHDFSRDRASVHEAIKRSVYYSDAERLPASGFPSLARFLDYDEGRDVANPEEALEVTARALQRLPGDKTMVFLGFGLGRFYGGDVLLGRRYDLAAERLALARVSVFALDVTQADGHSLAVGLKQVAADTGGAYFNTFRFPDIAVRKVAQAIAGHYVVYFYLPDDSERRAQRRRVRLKMPERKGSILLAPQKAPG